MLMTVRGLSHQSKGQVPIKAAHRLAVNRRISTRIFAMAAPTTIYVKASAADPSKLGDCPFCHRVLLTYAAKNLPYTTELIDFDNKPQWLQDVSGGKVPVIKEEGKDYMPDSDVITVHVEKEHPEPSLKSSVPPEIGSKLFPAFRGILLGPEAEQEDKKKQLAEELKAINDYLAQHGPLFGGDKLNATDAAVAPKLYHAVTALKHFKGWELPAEFSAVHKYLAALAAQPAWQATDYGHDAIIAGWKKHIARGH